MTNKHSNMVDFVFGVKDSLAGILLLTHIMRFKCALIHLAFPVSVSCCCVDSLCQRVALLDVWTCACLSMSQERRAIEIMFAL